MKREFDDQNFYLLIFTMSGELPSVLARYSVLFCLGLYEIRYCIPHPTTKGKWEWKFPEPCQIYRLFRANPTEKRSHFKGVWSIINVIRFQIMHVGPHTQQFEKENTKYVYFIDCSPLNYTYTHHCNRTIRKEVWGLQIYYIIQYLWPSKAGWSTI